MCIQSLIYLIPYIYWAPSLSKKLLKTHLWATLLHWVTCSIINTNTVVYFDSIQQTPSCFPKYSPEHQMCVCFRKSLSFFLKIKLHKEIFLKVGTNGLAVKCRRQGKEDEFYLSKWIKKKTKYQQSSRTLSFGRRLMVLRGLSTRRTLSDLIVLMSLPLVPLCKATIVKSHTELSTNNL